MDRRTFAGAALLGGLVGLPAAIGGTRPRGRLVNEMEAGTYELDRTLVLDRPGAVLVAKGPVILRPGPGFLAQETGGRDSLVAIRAPGVTMDGITLDAGDGGVGDLLHIRDAPDATVRGCGFTGLSEPVVRYCVLATSRSTDLTVEGSRFWDFGGTLGYATNGIGVRNGCERPIIRVNRFDNTSFSQGIVNYIGCKSSGADIHHNRIRHYEDGQDLGHVGGRGIFCDGDSPSIHHNRVWFTEGDMIGVDRTVGASISDNLCVGGREGGIEFAGATNVTVTGNQVYRCNNGGISFGRAWSGSGGVVISGNIAEGNGATWTQAAGILVRTAIGDSQEAARGFTLTGNISRKNAGHGIRFMDAAGRGGAWFEDVSLAGNITTGNAGWGMRFSRASGRMGPNVCRDNRAGGMTGWQEAA